MNMVCLKRALWKRGENLQSTLPSPPPLLLKDPWRSLQPEAVRYGVQPAAAQNETDN